ncbi:MAG TPA: hypothetical protein VFA43_20090 [Gemmatimonadaceae bacterium]|nr:hypothetical protein [Gemmatimonadaceae bacterium]
MIGPMMERQPDPALKSRIKSVLAAEGLLRRRRAWPTWVGAAAAVIVLAIGVSLLRHRHTTVPANTYVLLLDVEAYQRAPADQAPRRIAELVRWADSLHTVGTLERGGRLVGPGNLGGMFIIRAANDSDAARIAATCPFTKYGGRIEVKRFEE